MIKFIKNKLSNDKAYIYALSFLLPIILVLLIYIIKGIFPFGDRASLRMDLYHQYLPFHKELMFKLQNFRSLFYTFNVGLGTNFLSLFAYYLSCPFNILLFFVSDKFIIEYIDYITILKIALSSVTFAYYLLNRYKKENYIIIIFSIFYSMSGYVCAYYWNIMWLDNVILFPLLLYGFESIYYKNDGRMYIITLALTILCNYYIATLTCFMLVFYFVVLIVLSNQHNVKIIIRKLIHTIICSIIGILISCVLLLPIFMAFATTASNDFSFPKSIYEFFPIIDAIARHLPLVKIENGVDHWPNIYTGVFCIPLVIYYFLSKKVVLKRKIVVLTIFLFFMAAFCVNIANFLFHVCRYPNSLPSRYSFIYVFFILIISYIGIKNIKSIDKEKIAKSFFISIILVIVLQKIVTNEKVEFESFVVGIIFLIGYLVIAMCLLNKKMNKLFLCGIALFLFCFEAFINMYDTSITTVKRSEYLKKYDSIQNLKKYISSITNDFYRVEIDNRKSKDDGAYYNFPSASIFSSSCYVEGSDYYEKMGMEASMNAYSITGSTPFMDCLLSVKYILFDKKIEHDSDRNLRLLREDKEACLYENYWTLPLSFILNDKFMEKYDFGTGNPATAQNNFARAYDSKILLEPINVVQENIHANFTIPEDGDYYAFVLDKSINEVNYAYKNTSKKFENVKRGFFLELGYLEKGDVCSLRNDTNEKLMQCQVFKFRFDNMKILYDKIKEESSFKLNKFKDTYIDYNLESSKNGMCIVTIPFDEGWKIEVDGKEVEKQKIFDMFLGFQLDEGEHNITLKWTTRGFNMGLMCSILGIILLIIYLKNFNKQLDFLKKR